jgi:hypothetical protein
LSSLIQLRFDLPIRNYQNKCHEYIDHIGDPLERKADGIATTYNTIDSLPFLSLPTVFTSTESAPCCMTITIWLLENHIGEVVRIIHTSDCYGNLKAVAQD